MTSPSKDASSATTNDSGAKGDGTKPVAVITGASSGIGAASAQALADAGYTVYIGARRVEKLQAVAEGIDAVALPLDVTDQESVDKFCEQVPRCDVLVNNAGGAHGSESIADANVED